MSTAQYGPTNSIGLPKFFTHSSVLRRESQTVYSLIFKRVFDLGLALIMLPLLAPIVGVIWVIARMDGGPGFFGHRRIGRHGKTFRCWKIRTMVPDAETRLVAYLTANPDAAAEWERDHKLTNDPRITKIGRFLRATSLDELPQLWNVIRGDMSFVGPRPVVRKEMQKYGRFRSSYMKMRPGITGIWQVSGRNDVSYEDRIQMDVQYLYSASLALDCEIILSTGLSVIGKTGK